jgi:hypothetical protein
MSPDSAAGQKAAIPPGMPRRFAIDFAISTVFPIGDPYPSSSGMAEYEKRLRSIPERLPFVFKSKAHNVPQYSSFHRQ